MIGDGATGHSTLAAPARSAGTTGASPLPEPQPRETHTSVWFQVRSDRDKFAIFLDVKHFSPEDLTVKVQEDFVEIHGKHSERQVSPEPEPGAPERASPGRRDPGFSRRGRPSSSAWLWPSRAGLGALAGPAAWRIPGLSCSLQTTGPWVGPLSMPLV